MAKFVSDCGGIKRPTVAKQKPKPKKEKQNAKKK